MHQKDKRLVINDMSEPLLLIIAFEGRLFALAEQDGSRSQSEEWTYHDWGCCFFGCRRRRRRCGMEGCVGRSRFAHRRRCLRRRKEKPNVFCERLSRECQPRAPREKKGKVDRDEKKNAGQKDPKGCPHVLFGSSIADFVIMAFVCRRESKEAGNRV